MHDICPTKQGPGPYESLFLNLAPTGIGTVPAASRVDCTCLPKLLVLSITLKSSPPIQSIGQIACHEKVRNDKVK